MDRAARRNPFRRRVFPLMALLAVAITALSGCGFRPLYEDGERSAIRTLRNVEIGPIPDRVGQQVRNRLLDRLSPAGKATRPLYRLEVRVAEEKVGLAVETDDTVSRINLKLTARFDLRARSAERPLFSGTARTFAAYNITRSDYANLIAERDARSRAALVVADQITTRLAIFFDRRQGGDDRVVAATGW